MNLRTLGRGLVALAILLLPSLAIAQGVPAFQSGTLIPGHLLKGAGNGLHMDVGGLTGDANGRGASPFSITDGAGSGLCLNTAPTGGQHYESCFGHDFSGNAIWSVTANGGAINQSVYLSKNGTLYEIPFVGAGSGNVVGPSSSTVDTCATWNNVSGTLLKVNPCVLSPGTTAVGNLPLWNSTVGTAMSDSGVPFSSIRQSAQLNTTPGQFYVDAAGNDSADCLAATVTGGHGPCLTIAHAMVLALGQDGRQNSVTINIGAGTFSENVTVNGTSVGTVNNTNFVQNKLSTPMITLKGAGSGSTTISGGQTISSQAYCYAILANNGAMVSLQGMTVRATATPAGCNQSALFVQTNAIIFIDDDVKLGPANGDLISAEEHGGIYVTAGCGAACTGLTLAGDSTSGNGINISANSWFSADSVVNIPGAITLGGGLLFYAETNSLIKLSGNPGVTSGAPVTGGRFFVGAGSTMVVANPPTVWPGTIGGVNYGGRYYASDDIPCLGGAAGCSAVFAPTNIGGSGTAGMSANSGMYGGAILLSPLTGGGPAPNNTGVVYAGWTTLFPVGAICTAQLVDGTGTWDARATIKGGGFTTANDVHWTWDNNGVGLTSGSTYYIGYTCNTSK